MISAVSSHSIPLSDLRQLVKEVRTHGPGLVFDNRANRAEIFHKQGAEEFARREGREAGLVLDVYA